MRRPERGPPPDLNLKPRTIFVLPGMGADRGMYSAPSWQSIPGSRFLDWPEYRGESSIGAIANRLAQENAIVDGSAIIGTSLGGIVACEIANQVSLQGLALVSSAVHPSEISGILSMLHPLARLAPIDFIQAAVGKLPSELAGMFARSQASFIRASCAAIFEWKGLDTSRTTPLRIHGTHDHVIPMPSHADLKLEGGHLIAMSHADECVRFLMDRFV